MSGVKKLFEILEVIAMSVAEYVLGIRAYIHQRPGLRWSEEETATLKFIAEEVMKLHLPDVCGIIVREYEGGLVVELHFKDGLPLVLFRADVDGLPIKEETGLPYTSQYEGISHACGHDTHPAMLLGFIKAMIQGVADGKIDPTCNILCVFQRAEENPGTKPRLESGGAVLVNELLEAGIMQQVSEAHQLHITTIPLGIGKDGVTLENGIFSSRPRKMLGNSGRGFVDLEVGSNVVEAMACIYHLLQGLPLQVLGPHEPISMVCTEVHTIEKKRLPSSTNDFFRRIDVKVKTDGGHVALPEKGTNAIDVIMAILALIPQTVITPISFESGHTTNTLSAEGVLSLYVNDFGPDVELILIALEKIGKLFPNAEVQFEEHEGRVPCPQFLTGAMSFSLRNFLPEEKLQMFVQAIKDRINGVMQLFSGSKANIRVESGHPTLITDVDLYRKVKNLLEQAGLQTQEMDTPMAAGEDFAHYRKGGCPISAWMLAAQTENSGNHHQPNFNPDPKVLWMGVLFWLLLATMPRD